MGTIRIGTRDSRLAIWQAAEVQKHLLEHGHHSELVYIKSEGDLDLALERELPLGGGGRPGPGRDVEDRVDSVVALDDHHLAA